MTDEMSEVVFTKVRLPNGWLGNMAPYLIQADGRLWRTSEAIFQALRFTDADCVAAIHEAKSPMHAKTIAKMNLARAVIEPWSLADVDNMRTVIRLKIDLHPELKENLIALHGRIIEDCSARANGSGLFWGARRTANGGWDGQNTLGVLWMELREELAKKLRNRASAQLALPLPEHDK